MDIGAADFDDGEISGVDPADALIPGSEGDVAHQPDVIGRHDVDHVEPADLPALPPEAGQ